MTRMGRAVGLPSPGDRGHGNQHLDCSTASQYGQRSCLDEIWCYDGCCCTEHSLFFIFEYLLFIVYSSVTGSLIQSFTDYIAALVDYTTDRSPVQLSSPTRPAPYYTVTTPAHWRS